MIYLIIFGVMAVLLFTFFGVVGYFKSKKEYASFMEKTLSKLPLTKAEILELKIEKAKSGTMYSIIFINDGIKTDYTVDEDKAKVLYDLKSGEKPYVKYKYLKKDVAYPKVRGWVIASGFYDVEIHVNSDSN